MKNPYIKVNERINNVCCFSVKNIICVLTRNIFRGRKTGFQPNHHQYLFLRKIKYVYNEEKVKVKKKRSLFRECKSRKVLHKEIILVVHLFYTYLLFCIRNIISRYL